MNLVRFLVSVLILGTIAVTAAGCGRRAALDTPAQAAKAAGDKTGDKSKDEKPDRKFLLDPLIE